MATGGEDRASARVTVARRRPAPVNRSAIVLPEPPSDLPPDIAERLEAHARSARGALAPETERALRKASAAFTAWAATERASPLPCTAETVARYVDDLAERACKPATIRQAVWAVGTMHRAAGLTDPTKAEEVRLALKRMTRSLGTRQRQAAPVGEDDVRLLLRLVGPEPSLRVQRDVALLLTMRDLLARRSEAVALDVEDVTSSPDGSGTVLIRRSKTDQAGEGEVLWLSPRTMTHLKRWLDLAAIEAGAIFRAINKAGRVMRRLASGAVPPIVKGLAATAGLDASAFSGHSARVGMTQDLAAAGSELPAIMQAGRWKSPTMPARYAERQFAGRGAVARYYGRRGDGSP
ncbi:tyrosine-type recombinase/integrase (plasmid) [Roseomonas sp. CCTCC AB2023176]|uniref:tyrosine-type recombinase/integrase n=1 Tax=Roseomonas sp. CCTCC AB2023176 TaxID=3342640 RepID=UPI0035E27286